MPGARCSTHPRGLTITEGLTSCCSSRATSSSATRSTATLEYARHAGYDAAAGQPAARVQRRCSRLGVQNDSEKRHRQPRLLRRPLPAGPSSPVTPCERPRKRHRPSSERGEDKPGIAHIRTIGTEPARPGGAAVRPQGPGRGRRGRSPTPPRPWARPGISRRSHEPVAAHPGARQGALRDGPDRDATRTSRTSTSEEVIVHFNGRTITDEHMAWTYRVGNTHPSALRPHLLDRPQGPHERRADRVRRARVRVAERPRQSRYDRERALGARLHRGLPHAAGLRRRHRLRAEPRAAPRGDRGFRATTGRAS